MRTFALLICVFFQSQFTVAQDTSTTYAERLGFAKGARVLILHIDDAGMSYDSNEGTIQALTKGVANSVSVMMPCPWVPGFVRFLKANPKVDAGLHLTLTSEWKDYRWVPLMGNKAVAGLTDKEGAFWPNVEDVVTNASAEEVEQEIKAQLERARAMGFEPTHFDSHMGTLFATPAFLQKYVQLGITNKIPVMLPAGSLTLIRQQMNLADEMVQQLRNVGQVLWNSGLPVIDDLHNESYGWKADERAVKDDKKLQQFKTTKYLEAIRSLRPGVTMMIMHCTAPSEVFQYISDSGPTRKGDLLAMLDPALKKALADEKIILTTWRELMQRRQSLVGRNN